MKLLWLCLGLGVVCAYREGGRSVVKDNFDMSKASGTWYSISLASDRMEKIEENGTMRVFVKSMQVVDNSSLEFTFHMQ
ncbi:allergen Fel d 4-like [Rhynchocyon petersi]